VALGGPLFNRADHLPQALESLLGQTFGDFVLVAVDDASTDATAEVLARFEARDPRLSFVSNPRRLGMTANWRRAYALALARAPEADYFAWVSDHDVWHPRWLEALVSELDAHPEAVLAYPLAVGIDGEGHVVRSAPAFDTASLERPATRLRAAAWGMHAGDMVYGLIRAPAVARAGGFRSVLWPDRLLLAELTREGPFRQVPELLWWRRFAAPADAARQRVTLFAGRAPLVARLPWPIAHVAVLLRAAARGEEPGRGSRARFAARYLAASAGAEVLRTVLRARNRAGAWLAGRPGAATLLGAVEAAARAAGRPVKLRPAPPADLRAMAPPPAGAPPGGGTGRTP